MLALEFEPDAHPPLRDVHQALLARGLLVGFKPQAHLFRFYPPLVIDEADIGRLIASLDEILGGAS
jgi:acetylornithine/succinyldiaminopimelate/putrescine aminotransferase